MRTLNLGILAHVDAGKTTLTERLLYAAGVIDEIGRVDDGTTQTDTLALERQRGITIKSAVVSFRIGGVTVNLIDTPGHPEFIAEVERVLGVLDAAVLVVSCVEGVQAQTRILMRALQRLRIPTVIFVNKIDRGGADPARVTGAVAARLTPTVVPMGTVVGAGSPGATVSVFGPDDAGFAARLAERLAERDESILEDYVRDPASLSAARLRGALGVATREAVVHPLFFGSARTGAGIDELGTGIAELLPGSEGDPDGPLRGTVFKVERTAGGDKVAYVDVAAGTIRVRDVLAFGRTREGKVTALAVFEEGGAVQRPTAPAGRIAKLWGPADVRIGDAIGVEGGAAEHHFAPPSLETVVVPKRPEEGRALHVALTQLSEQDPLIDFRQVGGDLVVSLYGEVQKEVIAATLRAEHGIDVSFRATTPICLERPHGTGEALELLNAPSNPYRATIGLRVEPGPEDSGVRFRLDVDHLLVPVHLYKSVSDFERRMAGYVGRTLRNGLSGWQVTDCVVTMFDCRYSIADGPPKYRGPESTAADFRKLTPRVLRRALGRARTVVCEPIHRFHLEVPSDTLGLVLPLLSRLGAVPEPPEVGAAVAVLAGALPAARVHDLRVEVASVTRGEAVLETEHERHEPARGRSPQRSRDGMERAMRRARA